MAGAGIGVQHMHGAIVSRFGLGKLFARSRVLRTPTPNGAVSVASAAVHSNKVARNPAPDMNNVPSSASRSSGSSAHNAAPEEQPISRVHLATVRAEVQATLASLTASFDKKQGLCDEALQSAIDCEQLAKTSWENGHITQKATEDKLGTQTVMKRSLASVAMGVFDSIEHVKRCRMAHSFLESLGGIEKVNEINDQYDKITNKKLNPELMEYDDIITGLGAHIGALACMTWPHGGKSLVMYSEQPKVGDIHYDTSFKRTDIYFEVLSDPIPKTLVGWTRCHVSLDTMKSQSTVITGLNVQSFFDGFCTEDNLRILYDCYKTSARTTAWGAGHRLMFFESYHSAAVQKTCNAIQKQPGLRGILNTCTPPMSLSNKHDKEQMDESSLKPLGDVEARRSSTAGDDSDDEPVFVASKTRKQRDDEGRANAIDIS